MTYKVFLSSTSQDLVAHREAVLAAIAGLDGFTPIAMENFGARAAPPSSSTTEGARKRRAGRSARPLLRQQPRDGPPSFTEREYDSAVAAGIGRLMLVSPDDFPVPGDLIEPDAKRRRQKAFRTACQGGLIVEASDAAFANPAALASAVTRALANWRAEREQVDRITAELVAAKEAAANHRRVRRSSSGRSRRGRRSGRRCARRSRRWPTRRGSRTRRPRSRRLYRCCPTGGPRRPRRFSPRSSSASRWRARQPCRRRPPRRGISGRWPFSTARKRRSRPTRPRPGSTRTIPGPGSTWAGCISAPAS